jgi:hypothetical protein
VPAFSSRARSRIAAFSSALNPWDALPFVLLRFADCGWVLVAVFVGAIIRAPVRELMGTTLILWSRHRAGAVIIRLLD